MKQIRGCICCGVAVIFAAGLGMCCDVLLSEGKQHTDAESNKTGVVFVTACEAAGKPGQQMNHHGCEGHQGAFHD